MSLSFLISKRAAPISTQKPFGWSLSVGKHKFIWLFLSNQLFLKEFRASTSLCNEYMPTSFVSEGKVHLLGALMKILFWLFIIKFLRLRRKVGSKPLLICVPQNLLLSVRISLSVVFSTKFTSFPKNTPTWISLSFRWWSSFEQIELSVTTLKSSTSS